nr:MotA/TolQ/ExbB proton channel family protein [Endozoicomonas sp. OPT23]
MSAFGIDPTGPSGGSYLSALIDSPTLLERWHQGGVIGYIISGVGVFALLLGLFRLLILTFVERRVSAQVKAEKANTNNPLGRVLKVKEDNPEIDLEALELKLSETVLHEVPKLEKNLSLLKIIAAIAPLMGLLGTVTGMIITFQAITIFGAGDPKAMAGGISGALVTTVLGLVVAIPTILIHTVVNSRARKITGILVEQSTGIIAARSLTETKKITKTVITESTARQEQPEAAV